MQETEHQTDVFDRIRDAVLAATPAKTIYLFGSRATGTAKPDSDYDVLVVTDDPRSALEIRADVRMRLKGLGIPLDILLFSSEEFEWRRWYVNTIPNVADSEGLRLYG